jgi:hypothetical protein
MPGPIDALGMASFGTPGPPSVACQDWRACRDHRDDLPHFALDLLLIDRAVEVGHLLRRVTADAPLDELVDVQRSIAQVCTF